MTVQAKVQGSQKNGPKRPDNGGCGRELDDTEKAMIEALSKIEFKQEKDMSA